MSTYQSDRIWIHGVACFWNSPTDDGREKPFSIEREAFEFVDLQAADIKLTIDHEVELATVADGCLSIRADENGLFYSADLPRCSGSLELKRLIDSGVFSGSSVEVVGVSVQKTMNRKTGQHFLHIDKLVDVAIVTRPGNSRCFVSAHNIRQTLDLTRPARGKSVKNEALRASMRGLELALRGQHATQKKLAAGLGLTLNQLYANFSHRPQELSGSLLHRPDGRGGWVYLGR